MLHSKRVSECYILIRVSECDMIGGCQNVI